MPQLLCKTLKRLKAMKDMMRVLTGIVIW